jgi:hypothetical protein
LIVNTTTGGTAAAPGRLSLPQAVNLANVMRGPSTLTFDPAVFATPQTITLTAGMLALRNTGGVQTIAGPAAGLTISGDRQSRVFEIEPDVTATISSLTITGGGAVRIAAEACWSWSGPA